MNEKGGKARVVKNNKKSTKDENPITLRLNVQIPYLKKAKVFLKLKV